MTLTAMSLPNPVGCSEVNVCVLCFQFEAALQMMQTPMMQQLLSNPETLRNMLQMTPGVREVGVPAGARDSCAQDVEQLCMLLFASVLCRMSLCGP